MKKHSFLGLVYVLLPLFSVAQSETWDFQGFAVGDSTTGGANTTEASMPDVIKIGNLYYMYFGQGGAGSCVIKYATSPDLTHWTIQGTVLTGGTSPSDREYYMGGPRVVKLSNGQYRMFYRACESFTSEPPYHCRSAISNDGINFTKEGIRMDIRQHLPSSYFKRVAHSAFFKDANGTMRAILTGADTTLTGGPDRLYFASSSDDGLTWSNFSPFFNNAHDPVVVKDSMGTYHLYCSYLVSGFKKFVSSDGISWQANPDSVYFYKNGSMLTESSSPSIADLGGCVDSSGNIVIFSALKIGMGPWRNIAYYSKRQTTQVSHSQSEMLLLTVAPNPFSSYTTLVFDKPITNGLITILNPMGQVVKEIPLNGSRYILQREDLTSGIYFVRVSQKNILLGIQKLYIID